jgi:hypothetical protein
MELHMWNVEAGMVWNAFAHIAELHGGMLRNDCLEHANALIAGHSFLEQHMCVLPS